VENLEELINSASSEVSTLKSLTVKRKGEIAELAFMRKAISLGFSVAKPWGDSDRYDFILVCGQLLWRVQVKSAWAGPGYQVKTSGVRNVTYTASEIDFLVAYIIPEDLWYVVPVAALGSRKALSIRPHARTSNLAKYRDAWALFEAPAQIAEAIPVMTPESRFGFETMEQQC
jgi:PD-(D/E)XK nuclease superfamily protein